MAVQRLVLDTLTEENYELIAIHCSLESYRLAFLLNRALNLRLYRTEKDVNFQFDKLTANFPMYQYQDHFQYNTYSLLGNKFRIKTAPSTTISTGLFATEEDTFLSKFLIPELKKVDFFLKIETEVFNFSSKSLVTDILSIPQVITAYIVEYTELKSKNNLIFE